MRFSRMVHFKEPSVLQKPLKGIVHFWALHVLSIPHHRYGCFPYQSHKISLKDWQWLSYQPQSVQQWQPFDQHELSQKIMDDGAFWCIAKWHLIKTTLPFMLVNCLSLWDSSAISSSSRNSKTRPIAALACWRLVIPWAIWERGWERIARKP